MVSFGHTAVGTVVGLSTYHYFGDQNPALGLLAAGSAGVISHYITDLIPHGHFFKFSEYGKKVRYIIIFDLFLSIALFLYLSYLRFGLMVGLFYILFGIGGSQLPDVLDGLIYTKALPKSGFLKLENRFHQSTHWHGTLYKTLPWSIWDIWQVGVAVIALVILYG